MYVILIVSQTCVVFSDTVYCVPKNIHFDFLSQLRQIKTNFKDSFTDGFPFVVLLSVVTNTVSISVCRHRDIWYKQEGIIHSEGRQHQQLRKMPHAVPSVVYLLKRFKPTRYARFLRALVSTDGGTLHPLDIGCKGSWP